MHQILDPVPQHWFVISENICVPVPTCHIFPEGLHFKLENLVWLYYNFVLQGGTSCHQALSAPKHQSGGGPEAFFSPLPTSDSWPPSSPELGTSWSPQIRPAEGALLTFWRNPPGLRQQASQASPMSGTWRSPQIRPTWLPGPW
jgi:hypothetical protein